MKERPIIFTPENAQKCHVGSKTQTRRTMKPQPSWVREQVMFWQDMVGMIRSHKCPYGVVGDRLWVREAYCVTTGDAGTHGLLYRGQCVEFPSLKPIWKPSIHMPRWACRTVLEITEIRVQRLQDISEEDAKAEGIEYHNGLGVGHSGYRHISSHGYVYGTATEAYRVLWESINGEGSCEENPWVWALTFKRIS